MGEEISIFEIREMIKELVARKKDDALTDRHL